MSSRQNFEDDEWERTEQALSTLQLQNIPEPPQLNIPPDPPAADDSTIDSALLNALNNPRERMILFQIEDLILRFVRSNERSMEVPQGLNSFRRLLAYRLAARFGLMHISSEQLNENGERIITFYKTPGTKVPKVLLIDYSNTSNNGPTTPTAATPTEPVASSNERKESTPPIAAKSEASNPVNATPPLPPMTESGKKVLVMKRQTNANAGNQSNKTQETKPQLSAEEREKAYLEARARIFGDEGGNEGGDKQKRESPASTKTSSPAPFNDPNNDNDRTPGGSEKTAHVSERTEGYNVAATLLNRKEKIGKSASGNNLTDQSDETNTDGNASSAIRRSSSNPQVQNMGEEDRSLRRVNSRGKGKLVDVGSWKENKSQVRNVEAERSDPDFVRRGSPSVAQPSATANAGYNQDNNVYGSMPSPVGYDPRQMYPTNSYDANSPRAPNYAAPYSYNQTNMQYPGYATQGYVNNAYAGVPTAYPYPYSNDGMWNQPSSYDYGRNPVAMSGPPQIQPVYGNPADAWQQQQQMARGGNSPYFRNGAPPTNYPRGPSVNNRQDFPPLG